MRLACWLGTTTKQLPMLAIPPARSLSEAAERASLLHVGLAGHGKYDETLDQEHTLTSLASVCIH